MNEIAKRIAELSPQRRRLLEQLSRAQARATDIPNGAARPATPDPSPSAAAPKLDYTPAESGAARKIENRKFYNTVSQQLDATEFGRHAYFLNFGYVADESPQFSAVQLPARALNRNCVKLVLETIGACAITGRKVLDVGCGRGGTVWVLNRYFSPQATTGVDLSPQAIAFCTSTHRFANAHFIAGDAENLEFDDGSFDVVTNVESSHSYPDIEAFYRGVLRVLRPGGHFLYTDLLDARAFDAHRGFLQGLGFEIEHERDITRNVLLSCDETARVHQGAFRRDNDRMIADNFLGIPGSRIYDEMRTGRSSYRIYRFRKERPA